jgi:polyferredoxin
MPQQLASMPLLLLRLALVILVVLVATVLLRRGKVSAAVRTAFLVGGVAVLGFAFGLFGPASLDPNPVFALRSFLRSAFGAAPSAPPGAAASGGGLAAAKLPVGALLGVMLVVGLISNKGICGWACQLGMAQDLLYRIKSPKLKPPFWLTNAIRIAAFALLIGGLALAGLDWIGLVDPFQVFRLSFGAVTGIFIAIVLVASIFIYRPWCQFLCPYGLVSWGLEQFSIMRPRIDRDICTGCKRCVRACPGHAMADIYAGKAIHADCFACGACIAACPKQGAIGWRTSREGGMPHGNDRR